MTFELWALVAAVGIGLVHALGREGSLSEWGAAFYVVGRALHLPLHALGVPWLRTFRWNLASLGIVVVAAQLFWPAVG